MRGRYQNQWRRGLLLVTLLFCLRVRSHFMEGRCEKYQSVRGKLLSFANCSPEGQLYGTAYAQSEIFKHQFPSRCRRGLLMTIPSNGIGSIIHVIGYFLSVAMSTGRVLLLEKRPMTAYEDEHFCPGENFMDCYFLPITNCTIDSFRSRPVEMTRTGKIFPAKLLLSSQRILLKHFRETLIPPHFHELLRCSPVQTKYGYYWWRAQSATFFTRINPKTRQELQRLRNQTFPQGQLRPGTISMHVRRGDKSIEMEFLPNKQFLYAAMHVLMKDPSLRPIIFVSTEDQGFLDFISNVTAFQVLAVKIMRHSSNLSPMEYARMVGPKKEMLQALLNLQIALEADAFIGRLASNWCRLIDELRSTTMCKAHKVYFDPGQVQGAYSTFW